MRDGARDGSRDGYGARAARDDGDGYGARGGRDPGRDGGGGQGWEDTGDRWRESAEPARGSRARLTDFDPGDERWR